jgi:hypothetical protein
LQLGKKLIKIIKTEPRYNFVFPDRGRNRFKLKVLCQHTVLLGQTVDAVVGLAHPADGAADGVRLEGAGVDFRKPFRPKFTGISKLG